MNKRAPCHACGNTTDHEWQYEKCGHDIWKCHQCGTGFTETSGDFQPEQIYSDEYFSGGRRDGYADYAASESVLRRDFRSVLEEMKSLGCSSGNLLEIGCAYGFFLAEARRTFRVTGIEVSECAAKSARARGLEVFTAAADDRSIGRHGPYDAVVMLDVIEHLLDPNGRRVVLLRARFVHFVRRFASGHQPEHEDVLHSRH